jgi:subtilisin family serine protease
MKLLRVVIALCLVGVPIGVAASSASGSGNATADAAPDQYIVVLKSGANRAAAVAHAHSLGGEVFMQYRHALNGFAVRLPEAAVARLRTNPRVAFIAEDGDNSVDELPTGIDRIEADSSSTQSGDGTGTVNVNVAVLDTGIGLDRSDLNVVGGVDCTATKKATFDDPHGHGTHVAGTIAAKDDGPDIPNDPLEIVGVVPGAPLWAVRVLGKNGQGKDSQIICGIDWVAATRTDADPSNDIAVANMSLGKKGTDDGNCGLSNRDPIHLAICEATAAGVTFVVSAGNEAGDIATHVPAAYDEVLTVAAVADLDGQPGGLGGVTCSGSTDDAYALFSNFATAPADQAHVVAAPGDCIWSTWIAPFSAAQLSGTSMASPHVAGTVGLCIATGTCTGSPAQIIQKIVNDAAAYNTANPGYGFQGDPLRPVSGQYYGYLVSAGIY